MRRAHVTLGDDRNQMEHGNHTEQNQTQLELLMLRRAMERINDPLLGKAARKFVWGLIELAEEGALSCEIKDFEESDKPLVDRARLVSWVDEREEQKLEANATKKNILKLREEMYTQHQATFKHVAKIEEYSQERCEKEKSTIAQIHQILDALTMGNKENNKALHQLIVKVNRAENKLDAHWEELQRRLEDIDTVIIDTDTDTDTMDTSTADNQSPIPQIPPENIELDSATNAQELTKKKLRKLQAALPEARSQENKIGPWEKTRTQSTKNQLETPPGWKPTVVSEPDQEDDCKADKAPPPQKSPALQIPQKLPIQIPL